MELRLSGAIFCLRNTYEFNTPCDITAEVCQPPVSEKLHEVLASLAVAPGRLFEVPDGQAQMCRAIRWMEPTAAIDWNAIPVPV
jgi:hypothetical protein